MSPTRTLLISAIGFVEVVIVTAVFFWLYTREFFARGGKAVGVAFLRALTIYNPVYWIVILLILAVTVLVSWRWLHH